MKPTEYPEEESQLETDTSPAESESRSAAKKPRYLDLPLSPEQSQGQRNLALGVVCLVLALIGLWLGLKMDRGATLQCVAASLGTFGILWLFYNFQVMRQRHGQFLGLAVAAVLGALLPFVAAGLGKLDRLADERIAGKQPEALNPTVPPPVPTVATAPPAPKAPEVLPDAPENSNEATLDPDTGKESVAKESPARESTHKAPGKSKGGAAPAPSAPAVAKDPAEEAIPDDGQVHEYPAPVLDPKEGKVILVMQDCDITVHGRKWRIAKGQRYKFDRVGDDDDGNSMVFFMAGSQQVAIPLECVRFVGPSQETPQMIAEMAMELAMKKYPALARKGSPEEYLFRRTADMMQQDPSVQDLFKDPHWPIILADELADANKWTRADNAEDENAAGKSAAAASNGLQTAPPASVLPGIGSGLPHGSKNSSAPASAPARSTPKAEAKPAPPKDPATMKRSSAPAAPAPGVVEESADDTHESTKLPPGEELPAVKPVAGDSGWHTVKPAEPPAEAEVNATKPTVLSVPADAPKIPPPPPAEATAPAAEVKPPVKAEADPETVPGPDDLKPLPPSSENNAEAKAPAPAGTKAAAHEAKSAAPAAPAPAAPAPPAEAKTPEAEATAKAPAPEHAPSAATAPPKPAKPAGKSGKREATSTLMPPDTKAGH